MLFWKCVVWSVMLFSVTIFQSSVQCGAFLGAVCTLPMFSLAGWPPTSLVWGDRGGPGPYREPPPPYLVPLHCLLYYWPPHMEPPGPACNIIIYAIAHAASSSSTFILRSILAISNSIQGALLSLKGSSCIVSLALFGPSHI